MPKLPNGTSLVSYVTCPLCGELIRSIGGALPGYEHELVKDGGIRERHRIVRYTRGRGFEAEIVEADPPPIERGE